jgi:UDP-N-acetylmuramoyl-tripeptide--D-alanyl-D-alanine ligase
MSSLNDILYRLQESFLYNLPFAAAAAIWRRLLLRTTFIAITGSNGKTTTKDLLAGLLASKYPTVKTLANANGRFGLLRTILSVRPWHRFAVVEVGIKAPGQMWRAALVTRPDIVVITSVAAEHKQNFLSLEVTAAEKAKLLGRLGENSLAVLNGDDERVRDMAGPGMFRSVYFGTSSESDMWADAISGNWPERLRFRVHSGDQTYALATRLVGTHWTPSVLAALLTARECGVDVAAAVPQVARMESHPGRMQPVRLASGAVLIRDEQNGSAGTTEAAFHVFRQARAKRRIAILSDLTKDNRTAAQRIFALGQAAAQVADIVVFTGQESRHGVRGAVLAGLNQECAFGFTGLRATLSWLQQNLREGDVALLKGNHFHHLSRLYFGLLGPVACWKEECTRRGLCDTCPELLSPSTALKQDLPASG